MTINSFRQGKGRKRRKSRSEHQEMLRIVFQQSSLCQKVMDQVRQANILILLIPVSELLKKALKQCERYRLSQYDRKSVVRVFKIRNYNT